MIYLLHAAGASDLDHLEICSIQLLRLLAADDILFAVPITNKPGMPHNRTFIEQIFPEQRRIITALCMCG